MQTARKQLANSTVLNEDLKSGIITVTVTDESAQRAAAMSNAYAEELNRILVEQARSSARHERLFLENRLKVVRLDLDSAAKKFSDFSSKNAVLDMEAQGASLMESATALNAQLIARKSELAGLEQIYTDGNARVREGRRASVNFKAASTEWSGKPGAERCASLQRNDSVYPSIRELPLLGVAFSDLIPEQGDQEDLYENLSNCWNLQRFRRRGKRPA